MYHRTTKPSLLSFASRGLCSFSYSTGFPHILRGFKAGPVHGKFASPPTSFFLPAYFHIFLLEASPAPMRSPRTNNKIGILHSTVHAQRQYSTYRCTCTAAVRIGVDPANFGEHPRYFLPPLRACSNRIEIVNRKSK